MLTKKQQYQKKYSQRPEVKEKKLLSQRETYASDKGQAYEQKRRRTPKSRWMRSKCNARKRNKEWDIDLENYTFLISQPCKYCGGNLSEETGSSLDRKDNEKGYIMGNVNPCCKACNRRRSKSMSADEFERQYKLNKQKEE